MFFQDFTKPLTAFTISQRANRSPCWQRLFTITPTIFWLSLTKLQKETHWKQDQLHGGD